ncbi:hypothetical protein CYMTET_3117 [Cymbomonas tetramitiformis]|uniref:EGF-like domain-containing protein n=1 Tax=Cymbomonas tetramitiformis TaxID=36881 RepID=A0AAE0H3W2_9CHLO|nr:hypothetical protein CYMTET_3117 [Cymbomonas tetramitiformis]
MFTNNAVLASQNITASAISSSDITIAASRRPFPCQHHTPCHPEALCVDNITAPSSFTCRSCPLGYTAKDGACQDVDECSTGSPSSNATTLACSPLANCTNHAGGFSCSPCPAGYLDLQVPGGGQLCIDVDECSSNHGGCDFLSSCINLPGGVSCGPCPAGYVDAFTPSMDHICADVDECAEGRLGSMACAPQSHCINLPGGSSCGPCDPPDLYRGDGYECRLVQTCSEENGGCDLLTTCVSLEQGGVQCGGCPLGMSGSGDTRCVDVDGCREAPCFPGVECSDILPPEFGAVCGECPDGYVGDGRICEEASCTRTPAPCSTDPLVACAEIAGGAAVCGPCPPGYDGDGTVCTDVDECARGNGGCDSAVGCTNTPGGYSCGACPGGTVGDGHSGCRSLTNCEEQNGGCDPLTTCTDVGTIAPHQCGPCPAGYTGNGSSGCTDIDGCMDDSLCYPGVRCVDIPASMEDGNHVGGHVCGECPDGMVGDGVSCVQNMCFFDNGGCDPSVSCVTSASHPSGRVCGACPTGYTDAFTGNDGRRCEEVDGCRDEPCLAHRECVDLSPADEAALGVAYVCGSCALGFQQEGEACEDVDECAIDSGVCWMSSDGVARTECINTPGGYECGACPAGMRGSGRSGCTPVTDCSNNNGGCWVGAGEAEGFASECTDSDLGSVCGECPSGFEGNGASVCVDIDGCAAAPCFEGVQCADIPAPDVGYTCGRCPEGYRGDGEECILCHLRVAIEHTTVVGGVVGRKGWERGAREVIAGNNRGLDSEECVNTQGMRFWWSGASSDGSVVELSAARHTADTLVLNLPKADLVVWRTYSFQLVVALVGNSAVHADARTTFFVRSQPLVLAVRGGQLVTGESSPIVLEADSIDPDGEPEVLSVERHLLMISGVQGATPMQNYTFVVTGSKDSRVTEATTWLRIYPGSPPVPVIAPLLERVNPNSKLRLFGSARAMFPQDLTYEWTARSLGESAAPLNLTSRKVLASSSRFIPSIVLHEGVLVGGSEYVFQLATRDRQGVGTVQMAVQVNAPPQYGWVEIAPSVGLAYMDTFVLTAPGWVDEDSPMWFQYSCQAVGGETLMLNDFAPLARPVSTLSTVLPLEGLEAFAYQVTGRVTARDSLGATSEAERNITVTSPLGSDSGITSADLIQTLTGGIDESLGSGDSGLAMVLVDSVASILNSSSRSNESAALVAVQGDMLAHVAQVKEGAFPATSSVERFARSVSALSSDVQKLSDDAQLQSLGLLRGLVQDTQSVGVQL